MIDVKLDIPSFAAFGKKAITCQNEQVAQLCWNGNERSPVIVEGKRGGGSTRCIIKEGLACYKRGMIPVGLIHTHPEAAVVEIDPTKVAFDDSSTTAFSPMDVISAFEKREGLLAGILTCLAGQRGFACIAPFEYPPRSEVNDLKFENDSLERSFQAMVSVMRKSGKHYVDDEIRNRLRAHHADAEKSRSLALGIIKKHGNAVAVDTEKPRSSTIPILIKHVCELLKRHDDMIRSWIPYREMLVKKSNLNATRGPLKKMAESAAEQLDYIKHRGSIMIADQNFGKC